MYVGADPISTKLAEKSRVRPIWADISHFMNNKLKIE